MTRRCLWILVCVLSSCVSRKPAQVGPAVPWAPNLPPPSNNSGEHGAEGGAQPAANPSSASTATCGLRLDNVAMGGGQSVTSVLLNLGMYGTFTGNWGSDRAVLAPWFSNSGPGSAVYAASKDSRAFFRALQYVNGNSSDFWGTMNWNDYLIAQRTAGVIAAMMAVSQDPECVRYVRAYADRILGGYAKELDDLPWLAASQLVHDKQIQGKFDEVSKNREQLEKQIAAEEKAIARKERENEIAVRTLQTELNARYKELRYELQVIGPCKDTVSFEFLTSDPNSSDLSSKARDLMSSCGAAISERLAVLKEQDVETMARIREMQLRHGNQNFEGSEESRLNEKLKQNEERTRKLQEYQDMLKKGGPSSLTSHIDRLDVLLKNRDDLLKKEAVAEEVKRKNELEERLRQYSARWLTYGYFGGFPRY